MTDGTEDFKTTTCPECESEAYYDETYDFYACPHCGQTWSYGANDLDPDHEDFLTEDEFFDLGLMRDIEQLGMYGRRFNDKN